jgi:hypothetical protein
MPWWKETDMSIAVAPTRRRPPPSRPSSRVRGETVFRGTRLAVVHVVESLDGDIAAA